MLAGIAISRAIARRMRQRNRFGRAVQANRVGAGNVAGARRSDIDGPAETRLLHRGLQKERRPRWRVLLRGMVNFPRPGFVFRFVRKQLRRGSNDAEKSVHAD